jgi:5-methylcytosine-specific restriction endonuclease McrA
MSAGCEYRWSTTFSEVVISGKGCRKCAKRFTDPEDANSKLNSLPKERGIKAYGEYVRANHIHDFECLRCGREWKARYIDVLGKRQTGCRVCESKSLTDQEREISYMRRIVRKRISLALIPIKLGTFSSFHNDDFLAYCQIHFISMLPKPHKDLTLDHILPLNFFDPTNDLEMRLCWHRNNLRWLTRVENSSKNNKIIFDLFDDWHYLVYNLVSSGSYDVELAKNLLD